jgi:hypothetical protein
MRTHLINTIAHATDPAPVTNMGGPSAEPSGTTLADHTSAPVSNRPSTQAATTTNDIEHTPAPSSPSPLTNHTPPVNRGQKRSTPTPDDEDERVQSTRGHTVRNNRTGVRQRTSQPRVPTHHMVARDCVPNLHWEGERNDQCEAYDQGGILTECTRCKIVWHASCLASPLPFPLRPQDEIVCSEDCWTELVQATMTAGGTEPQREDPSTSRKFLLHTPAHTSNRPTLYPTTSHPIHTHRSKPTAQA